ncbi:hypothetical protein, partial [Mycobacterium tuberculosis]
RLRVHARLRAGLRPTTTVEAYWRSRRFDLGDYRISS